MDGISPVPHHFAKVLRGSGKSWVRRIFGVSACSRGSTYSRNVSSPLLISILSFILPIVYSTIGDPDAYHFTPLPSLSDTGASSAPHICDTCWTRCAVVSDTSVGRKGCCASASFFANHLTHGQPEPSGNTVCHSHHSNGYANDASEQYYSGRRFWAARSGLHSGNHLVQRQRWRGSCFTRVPVLHGFGWHYRNLLDVLSGKIPLDSLAQTPT